jgi:hypothetical protein
MRLVMLAAVGKARGIAWKTLVARGGGSGGSGDDNLGQEACGTMALWGSFRG